ncbi:MAG: NAD(P)-dependent oxidoreductase [Steroidobacteraceae bacterium]
MTGSPLRLALNVDAPGIEQALMQGAPDIEIVRLSRNQSTDCHADAMLTPMQGSLSVPKALARCHGLQWVHVLGTGVDGFPFELAGDRLITCSRGASAVPMAEWVLAMMLCFEKQLPASWMVAPPAGAFSGHLGTLEGRTLGLLGFGAIGKEIATRALAFDMRIVAKVRRHRPSPVPDVEFVESLDAVLGEADHLVLALPATRDSHRLLDASRLASTRPGVHLVNVARASLLDQEALHDLLDSGHIAAASLDVAEPEPPPAGHWLYGHPRVRVSPHISWSGPKVVEKMLVKFLANLHAFRKGEPLEGLVDVTAGY